MKRLNTHGMTLPELLMATVILASLFSSVLLTILKCVELSDIAANQSAAVASARNKITEMDNTAFDQLIANYHNVAFNVADIPNARGVTYVTQTNADLYTIYSTVCWQQRNGRLFGEDADLDGQLDAGEDSNGNGRIDSIVSFTTQRYDI